MSGFYTLAGDRCGEFSEFAGTIRSAKVNPSQISGQQDKVSGSSSTCAIAPGVYSVIPPASLTTGVIATGKTSPYDGSATNDCKQAANMRRCPILVRAAIVTSCPGNPIPPSAQKSYTDAGGLTHCLSATSIRIFMRIEQIYEVAGMPKMQTSDTLQDQGTANALSVSDLIQAKVGNTCQGGTTSSANGICMGCPANCGNPRCTVCTGGMTSAAGTTGCH